MAALDRQRAWDRRAQAVLAECAERRADPKRRVGRGSAPVAEGEAW